VYGRFPKPTTVDWHNRLVKTYPGRINAAMRQAIEAGAGPGDLLSETEKLLKADKATAAEDRRWQTAQLAQQAEKARRAALPDLSTVPMAQLAPGLAALFATPAEASDPPQQLPRGNRADTSQLPRPVDREAEIKARQSAARRAGKIARRERLSADPKPWPAVVDILAGSNVATIAAETARIAATP
jgi:hypothetical protein